MTIWQAVILGIVQGITEFLPVSSDGHLVVVQHLLGLSGPLLTFDVFIHLGTLAAVLLYFRKLIAEHVTGLFNTSRRPAALQLLWQVVVATIPAVIVGLLLKDAIEKTFGSAYVAAVSWFVMGLLLIWSVRYGRGSRRMDDIRTSDSWWIGTAQVFALLPGISRSGMTIITGMKRGLAPVEAARFSFLMSIPAVAGAEVLQLSDVQGSNLWSDPAMLSGAIAAFVVGLGVISFLLKLLNTGNLKPFGYYCIGASVLMLGYLVLNGS